MYIRQHPNVEKGEISAVMVGEKEATLKRFKQVGDTVFLIPENNKYDPLILPGKRLTSLKSSAKPLALHACWKSEGRRVSMALFFKKAKKSSQKENNHLQQTHSSAKASQPQSTLSFNIKISDREPQIPPLQGDYAKTLFLWVKSKPSAIWPTSDYPQYIRYECGIQDTVSYHRTLIKDGYFMELSIPDRLTSLKIPELKDLLRELILPVSGKKEILIQRIIDNSDDAFIISHCPSPLFALTDKGHSFLEHHDDYIKLHLHKTWGVDWQDYDTVKQTGADFYTTMLSIFEKRYSSKDWQTVWLACLNMYELYSETNNREKALEMLLRCIYFDLSGTRCIELLSLYSSNQKDFFKRELKESFKTYVSLAPGLANSLQSFSDIYHDKLLKSICSWELPIKVCSEKQFSAIVHKIQTGGYDEELLLGSLRASYNKAVDRFLADK